MPKRGISKTLPNPSLGEIFELCGQLKLTFADLISEVFHNEDPEYQMLSNDNIRYNGKVYNLIQDGRKEQTEGLEQLELIKQVKINTQNIIEYLKKNSKIKIVYFTRQPNKRIWKTEWNRLRNYNYERKIEFQFIYSPTARPLKSPQINNLLNLWINGNNI